MSLILIIFIFLGFVDLNKERCGVWTWIICQPITTGQVLLQCRMFLGCKQSSISRLGHIFRPQSTDESTECQTWSDMKTLHWRCEFCYDEILRSGAVCQSNFNVSINFSWIALKPNNYFVLTKKQLGIRFLAPKGALEIQMFVILSVILSVCLSVRIML